MINYIVSEYSKFAQKEYKTKHNRAGKMIHWELCKKLKFNQIFKWYIRKSEFVIQNEMHKILCDFEIKTDHLISARRPDLVIIKKKKRR